MSLSMFALIEAFVLIAGVILTAWYRPAWLQTFSAAIARFAAAVQAFRAVINGPSIIKVSREACQQSRKPSVNTPAPITLTPVQQDVLDALVAQGANPKHAKAAVSQAIAALPTDAGFDDLFKKAVAA